VYTLTITVDPAGAGTVNAVPSSPYHYGDVVQLTANANPGWTFSSWTGNASGSTSPTSVTMDGNKAVTAHFVASVTNLLVEDFEDGDDWTAPGPVWTQNSTSDSTVGTGTNPLDASSVYQGQLKQSCSVTTSVNTVGKYNIAITFQSTAQGLETGEYMIFDVSYDGSTWTNVANYGNHDWTQRTIDLSSFSGGLSDNNPNFKIRFRINGNENNDKFFIDNIGCYTIFSDNFDDNILDTSNWTTDVVGSGNSYQETNHEAKFTVYGHSGWDYGHAILLSKTLNVPSWTKITISTKFRLNSPSNTAELQFLLFSATDPTKAWGVTYHSYGSYIWYHYDNTYIQESRSSPTSYVTFKVILFNNGTVQYWENGVKLKEVTSSYVAGTNSFKLRIGGWDYSAFSSNIYFDNIGVNVS